MSTDEPGRTVATLMGIRNKRRDAGTTTNMLGDGYTQLQAPETAWGAYNRRAAIFDKELIKDWNDSLNTLLIFAALYSAALTAFITESMKLLKEDPAETTRDILLVMSKQLANSSTPAFEPEIFVVKAYAIRVNIYFFISISSSLITAFGSVLALQWVGSYDFGLNPSSPKVRALQRHFRYTGIKDWRMVEIIALLPLLLFLSLFLFLIGLADWLFHIHRGISAILMLGGAVSAIFYVTTTIISLRHADAPFRTPVSKSLPVIYQTILAPFKRMGSFFVLLWSTSDNAGIIKAEVDSLSFAKREERAIKANDLLELDCLLWTVNSIDVLPHSRDTFKVLIEAFMNLSSDLLLHPKVNNAPWLSIFTMLCQPYFKRKKRKDYTEVELTSGEIPFLARGIAMIGKDLFHRSGSENLQGFISSLLAPLLSSEPLLIPVSEGSGLISGAGSRTEVNLVNAYARHARCLHMYNPRPWEFLLSLRSILAGPAVYPPSFSKLALVRLQTEQANRPALFYEDRFLGDIHQYIAKYNNIGGQNETHHSIIPSDLLDIILQMMTTDISGRPVPPGNPLTNYLTAYEEIQRSGIMRPFHRDGHDAIRRQYIIRLEQLPEETQPSQEFNKILLPICEILSSTSEEIHTETVEALLEIFIDTPFANKLWNFSNEVIASIVSLVLCNKPTLHITNWQDWFVQISTGCDERVMVTKSKYKEHTRLSFLRLLSGTVDRIHDTYFNIPGGININNGNGLERIQTPYIKLILSAAFSFPQTANPHLNLNFSTGSVSSSISKHRSHSHSNPYSYSSSLLSAIPLELWDDPLWQETVQWTCDFIRTSSTPTAPAFITFIRSALAHGSHLTREKCAKLMARFRPFFLQGADIELFQEATLHNLLTIKGDSVRKARFKIFYSMSHKPWFCEVFSKAGGFACLEEDIANISEFWLPLCIPILSNAATFARTYTQLVECVNCLRKCLEKSPLAMDENRHVQTQQFKSILEKQGEVRKGREVMAPDNITPIHYHYVQSWRASEWDDWCGFIEGIIAHLEKGYITTTARYSLRDHDGICTSADRHIIPL